MDCVDKVKLLCKKFKNRWGGKERVKHLKMYRKGEYKYSKNRKHKEKGKVFLVLPFPFSLYFLFLLYMYLLFSTFLNISLPFPLLLFLPSVRPSFLVVRASFSRVLFTRFAFKRSHPYNWRRTTSEGFDNQLSSLCHLLSKTSGPLFATKRFDANFWRMHTHITHHYHLRDCFCFTCPLILLSICINKTYEDLLVILSTIAYHLSHIPTVKNKESKLNIMLRFWYSKLLLIRWKRTRWRL